MVFATVVTFAFRDDELDELLSDHLKRTNDGRKAVLHPIVRLAPYLVGQMMRFIVVVCFQAFSDLLATSGKAHRPDCAARALEKDKGLFRVFRALQHGASERYVGSAPCVKAALTRSRRRHGGP